MRTALLEAGQKPLTIVDDVEANDPGPGQVLVRVHYCGICHSDLTIIDSANPAPLPVVLGHEAAGVVEAVGAGVRSVAPGDRVVSVAMAPCGRCYFCVRGEQTICIEARTFMTVASMKTRRFLLTKRANRGEAVSSVPLHVSFAKSST